MSDKFIIYLVGISRSPTAKHVGEHGKSYVFRWSEQHKAMIYEGREITAAEFDEVAADIFGASADQNIARPVPKRIQGSAMALGERDVFTLPRFNEREQLLRACTNLGKAELETARLQKELDGYRRGGALALPTAPKPVAVPPPAPPEPKARMEDFDPDDAIPNATPSRAKAIPIREAVPKVNPAPSLAEGDFDPDEMPAGQSVASVIG